jgi:hypothetical protein
MPFGDHRTLMLRESLEVLNNLKIGILHLIGTFPYRTAAGIHRILVYISDVLNELTNLLGWQTDQVLVNERASQILFNKLKIGIEATEHSIYHLTNSERLTGLIGIRTDINALITVLEIAINHSYGRS